MDRYNNLKKYHPSKSHHLQDDAIDALNDAWNSIAKTKKELSSVSSKIQVSQNFDCRSPDILRSDISTRKIKMKKSSSNVPVEIVKDDAHVKENIPPFSIPKPLLREDGTFFPTRKILYNTDFTRPPNNVSTSHSNMSFVAKDILKKENKKEALSRLKEKINQQKMNLTSNNSSMEAHSLTNYDFPEKLHHSEDSPVNVNIEENDQVNMKRKVTQAPNAPSYKGFNTAVSVSTTQPSITQFSRHIARKERQIEISKNTKKSDQLSNHKAYKPKRGKTSKPNRIIAPKKTSQAITTSSWRLSENIKKKLKSEMMKEKSLVKNQNHSCKSVTATEISKQSSNKTNTSVSAVASSTAKTTKDVISSNKSNLDDGRVDKDDDDNNDEKTENDLESDLDEQPLDEAVTGEIQNKDDKQYDNSKSLEDLSHTLTATAQQVLEEMRDSPPKAKRSSPSKKTIQAVIDTGINKSSFKRSPPIKRKLDELTYPKSKVRHDKSEVQKYMAKQLAQRKKQKEKEEGDADSRKAEQKRKMEELYKKQKAALHESLKSKKNYSHATKMSSTQEFQSDIQEHATEYAAFDSLRNKLANISSALHSEETRKSFQSDSISNLSEEEWRSSDYINIHRTSQQSYDNNHSADSIDFFKTQTALQNVSHSTVLKEEENEVHYALPPTETISAYEKSKADRVAAIRATAEALKQRLDIETKRLTNLAQQRDEKIYPPSEHHGISKEFEERNITAHRGELPGVSDLNEVIETNDRIEKLNKAAEKIQAAYRGSTVRQRFQWNLPSGKTLYQTLEEGRRRALLKDITLPQPIELASSKHPSVLSTINLGNGIGKPIFASSTRNDAIDIPRSFVHAKSYDSSSTTTSNNYVLPQELRSDNEISEVDMQVENILRDQLSNVQITEGSLSKEGVERNSPSVNNMSHHPTLNSILKRHTNTPPDKYSVINVFTRKYAGFKKLPHEDNYADVLSTGTDTEKLLADAYSHEFYAEISDNTLSEQTIREESHGLHSNNEKTDERTEEVMNASFHSISHTQHSSGRAVNSYTPAHQLQRQFLSPKSAAKTSDDSDESEKLFSPHSHTPDSMKRLPENAHLSHISDAIQPSNTSSRHTQGGLSPLTPISLSEKDEESYSIKLQQHTPTTSDHTPTQSDQTPTASDLDNVDLNPVMSSTRRSPRSFVEVKDGTPLRSLNHQNTSTHHRMSPNTLEMKLHAEINMFDAVRDSLQQLDDMERIRNIVQAQQESVALAQIVKSKQRSHQTDLDKLSLQAKERSLQAAAELEAARNAATLANIETAKTLAEIKSKTSDQILESTETLAKVQVQATATANNAIERIDVARQQAADAYKMAAERQIVDVEKIATAAASAASSQAVEVALRHHKEQLEALRAKSLQRLSNESFSKSSQSSSSSSTSKTNNESSNSTTTLTNRSEQSEINSHTRNKSTLTSVGTSLSKKSSQLASVQTESLVKKNDLSENSKSIHSGDDSNISEQIDTLSKKSSTRTIQTASPRLATNFDKSSPHTVGSAMHSTVKESTITQPSTKMSNSYSEGSVDEELPDASKDESIAFSFNDSQKDISVTQRMDSTEEKFHSSMTEDELKHEFRMVLPSENHRRKSLSNMSTTAHETSSDELLTPRLEKKAKSPARNNNSTFFEEDTFQKFTSEMVRQYIQEEEMRAKHQAALLSLREKAIVDKTKAEMAFLEMKKKKLKGKGRDDRMPPIAKKQRALVMRLQAEKSEIRRLQEAHHAASEERKFMLKQQRQIQRIREATHKIWNKVKEVKPSVHTSDVSNYELSASEALDLVDGTLKSGDDVDELSQINQSSEKSPLLSKEKSISASYESPDRTLTPKSSLATVKSEILSQEENASIEENIDDVSERETVHSSSVSKRNNDVKDYDNSSIIESSTISKDLKKLNYISSEDYLTKRERKLRSRQQKLHDIIDADSKLRPRKQQLDEDEVKLRKQIKKALDTKQLSPNVSHKVDSEESIARSSTSSDDQPINTQSCENRSSNHVTDTDVSIGEDVPSIASNDESISSETGQSEVKTSVRSVKTDSLSQHSVQSVTPSRQSVKTVTPSPQSNIFVASKENSLKTSKRSSLASYSQDTFEESIESTKKDKKEEEPLTEGNSDASDVEVRLKTLEKQLQRRYSDLEKLRKQKEKQQLRRRERALLKELQAVEREIDKEIKEYTPTPETTPTRTKQPPRVLSPRSSIDSIILPEKIKLRKEKDFRRTLDLSDKELSDSSLSPRSISKKSTTKKSIEPDEKENIFPYPPHNRREKSISEKSPVQSNKSSDKSNEQDITEADDISLKSTTASISEKLSKSSPNVVTSTRKISDSIHHINESNDEVSEKLSSSSNRSSIKSVRSNDTANEFSEERSKNKSPLSSLHEQSSVKNITTREESVINDYDDESFESTQSSGGKKSKTNLSRKDGDTTVATQQYETDDFETSGVSLQSIQNSQRNQFDKSNEEMVSEVLDVDESEISKNSESERLKNQVNKSENSFKNEDTESISREQIQSGKQSFILSASSSASSSKEDVYLQTDDDDVSLKSVASELSQSLSTAVDLSNKQSSGVHHSNESLSEKSTSGSTLPDLAITNRSFSVGDRVLVENSILGTIRFLGSTPFSPVPVVGVELDTNEGTNDGSFQGKRYFVCSQDRGLFTTVEKLKKVDSEDVKVTNDVTSNDTESLSLINDKDYSKFSQFSDDSKAETSSENDDDESLEVPSPRKLDLNPLAESITDGIMKNLLQESFESSKKAFVRGSDKISENVADGKDQQIDNVLHKLLQDAITHIIDIKENKEEKLEKEIKLSPRDSFMSLIISDTSPKPKSDVDLSDKLEQLKSVHDQLGDLLGDDDDDEDLDFSSKQSPSYLDDDDDEDDDELETPKKVETVEKIFRIPMSEKSTQQLVYTAYQEVLGNRHKKSGIHIKPSPEYFAIGGTDEKFDETYTKLFKELIFDLTKSLAYDVEEFKNTQGYTQSHTQPKWRKTQKRTFAKFVRKNHLTKEEYFSESLSEYIATCLGLLPGRPSLDKLRKKLPLNPAKKDYVDAILIEEIREEEPQWVNYENDELTVKCQLADNILDSLLDEIVDTLSTAS